MRMFHGNQAIMAFLRAMLAVKFGDANGLAPAYVSQRASHCNVPSALKAKARQRRHGLYRRHVFPKD